MLRACVIAVLFAGPALADFPETVGTRILPGYADFAKTTQALAQTAQQSCDLATLQSAFNAAFDAWVAVQHIQFGPIEDNGNRLAIEYWPDPKGQGAKAQRALLQGDPAQLAPDAFAEQSVAARGLSGLERLIYPAESAGVDTCPLIRATALDLARMAADVQAAWVDDYAATVLSAGDQANTTFLNRSEVRQVMFTQIASGLEFLADTRLGRPLGTFDAPHPERAESKASGRSLRNVVLSLQAMQAMAQSLTPDAPLTTAAFQRAIDLAQALDDPIFAGVASPDGRLKVEILQQAVTATRDVVISELGPELDVGIGFNAQDGD